MSILRAEYCLKSANCFKAIEVRFLSNLVSLVGLLILQTAMMIFIFALLSGCSDFSKEEPAGLPPPTQIEIKPKKSDKPYSVTIEEHDKTDKSDKSDYLGVVEWLSTEDEIHIYVNNRLFFKSKNSQVTSCIVGMITDTNYKIKITSVSAPASTSDSGEKMSNPEEKTLLDTEVKTPLDIDLALRVRLAPINEDIAIQAHRVFFESDQDFYTHGHTLKIITDKLIAKGIIRTFDERATVSGVSLNDSKAPLNENGKSGGSIFIKAKEAIGHLEVKMQGQDGGDGSPGAPYSERAPNGNDGEPAKTSCPGEAMDRCLCDKKGGDGTNGTPGNPGRKGLPGKNGGNSGKFHLEISQASPKFSVSISKQAGRPGTPGPGGLGQLGGLGGAPGVPRQDEPFAPRNCSGNPGLDAAQGNPGLIGDEGSSGVMEPECISVGEGFGKCS